MRGYSEGSRAATSIELGCADPDEPCKLPNAMAGDPPLEQVVTRTWEAGVRGQRRGVSWNAGVFRARQPRRHPVRHVRADRLRLLQELRRDAAAGARARRAAAASDASRVGAGYTFLDATFESEETVNGESNSTNDAAENGEPGLEGTIEIEPGDRIPLHPGAHAEGVRRRPGHVAPLAWIVERDRGVELVRARQREQPARARRRRTTSDPARRPATPSSISAARYRLTRWLQVDRADQQSVRSPLLHRRASSVHCVHGHRHIHRPAVSRGRRRVPRPAAARSSRLALRCGCGRARVSRSRSSLFRGASPLGLPYTLSRRAASPARFRRSREALRRDLAGALAEAGRSRGSLAKLARDLERASRIGDSFECPGIRAVAYSSPELRIGNREPRAAD